MERLLERIEARPQEGEWSLALPKVAARQRPFQVLVACIISLRTRDEVTDEASKRLFEAADSPERLVALEVERIAELIYPAAFYRNKAVSLQALARSVLDEHQGRVPDTMEGLLALQGVGRKTANLVLTMGFGKPGICVDIHVHRICNRLGFVKTTSADDTEQVLREILPARWWIPINQLLVSFGRAVCAPVSPRCSSCPVAEACPRVGVGRTR